MQNQMSLDSGVQNIVEDASARGVLRSTLPVDARQSLTAQLGVALNEGLGKIGLQRSQDISAVRQQVGSLRIDRAQAISELARALETNDLAKQELALKKLQANREYKLQLQEMALARQELAARSSGGGGGGGGGYSGGGGGGGGGRSMTNAERLSAAASTLGNEMRKKSGSDGFVSPDTYAAARREWGAAGYVDFDRYFGGFKNPKNPHYY